MPSGHRDHEAGVQSALVLSGNTKHGVWFKQIVQPTYVFPSVEEVLQFMKSSSPVKKNATS